MQVVNANKRVTSLEVSTDGGKTWQQTTRQSYNFFENSSGFGTSSVDVKVTSVDGDVVIVNDVQVTPDSVVTASANFPSSGTVIITTTAVIPPPSTTTAEVLFSTSPEAPVLTSTPTPTTSGAAFVQAPAQGSTTSVEAVITTSSVAITPAATPIPSPAPEIVYVTIDACPA
jgi:hypothetical protein